MKRLWKQSYNVMFLVLAVGAGIFSFNFFSSSFPLLNVEILMNQQEAIDSALAIKNALKIGPKDAKVAAIFDQDSYGQTFVELKEGGSEKVNKLINDNVYHFFYWRVRLFVPKSPHELEIRFLPNGDIYDFREKIPENAPGAQLSKEEALRVAKKQAAAICRVDFDDFTLLDSSFEKSISDRVDHSFIFARKQNLLSSNYVRLGLVVSGDKLSSCQNFLYVPQAFSQSYSAMRSKNENFSKFSLILISLLYGSMALASIVILLRSKLLLFKWPLLIALGLGALDFLSNINAILISFLWYNTSQNFAGFVLSQLMKILFSIGIRIPVYFAIIAIAEALTRIAKPEMIRFFSYLKPSILRSKWGFNANLIAYLFVPLLFSFVLAFYYYATKYFSWWLPSTAFISPEILASFFPALNPLVRAIHAGLLEECIFRALPLSCAIILDRKYKTKIPILPLAFILQAFIFAAAHANYPMQPSYARIVELILPSFVFGFLYLRYGLTSAALAHIVYDIVWMAMPIFVANDFYMYFNAAFVLLIALLPLVVGFLSWAKHKSFYQITDKDRNKTVFTSLNWASFIGDLFLRMPSRVTLSRKTTAMIILTGVLGGLMLLFSKGTPLAKSDFFLTRTKAVDIAKNYVKEQGIKLDPSYRTLTTISSGQGKGIVYKYVWDKYGEQTYNKLLGKYLATSSMTVRFARFSGTDEEKARQYFVTLDEQGKVSFFGRQVAEQTKLESLSHKQARELAIAHIVEKYEIPKEHLVELRSSSRDRPNRTDWYFIFANSDILEKGDSSLRHSVDIIGNFVASSAAYVHLPEAYLRTQNEEAQITYFFNQLSYFSFVGLMGLALVLGILGLALKYFALRQLLITFCAFLVLLILNDLNNVPAIVAGFTTSQPYSHQIFRVLSGLFLREFFSALAVAMVIILTLKIRTHRFFDDNKFLPLGGLIFGIFYLGAISLAQSLLPSRPPVGPSLDYINSYVPSLSIIGENAIIFIRRSSVFALLILFVSVANRSFQKYKILSIIGLFSLLVLIYGPMYASLWQNILIMGTTASLCIIIAYLLALRLNHGLVPLMVALIFSIGYGVNYGQAPASTSLSATVVSIAAVFSIASFWYKKITTNNLT